MEDGKIIIGTHLTTKELDKQYNQLQRDLEKKQKEAEKFAEIKSKIDVDLQKYEKEKELIKQTTDELLKKSQTEEQVNWVLDTEKMQIEQLNEKYSKQFSELDKINGKIEENTASQEMLKQQITQTNTEIQRSKGLDNIKAAIKGASNSMEELIHKITRWGLALFGIHSAYMGIRRAISIVSSENEQVENSFQQIRKVIAGALLPLVQTIVNWIAKLMVYVNYIWKVLTGKNLFNFADATKKSAKDLKSGAGSSGKIAKNLEKAKKQLAGFDEMNVLQDQEKDTGSSGAGGVGGAGDTDFGNMFDKLKDIPIPEWLKWIADHGQEIISLLAGITAAMLALKLGASGLTALGIGIMVTGLVYAIQSLLKYLKEPTWKNFGKIIQGIGIAVVGIGVAFLGLPAVIVGVVILIWGTIVKYWDKIEAFLNKGVDWLKGKSDWVHKTFGDTIGGIYDTFVKNIKLVVDWLSSTMKLIKKNFDEIIKFVKNVFAGNWKSAWQNIKNIFSNIWTAIKNTFNTILQGITNKVKNIASTTGNVIASVFKGVVNAVLSTIETLLNSPIRAINSMIGIINKLPKVNISTLPTFNLPRLAKGGIVNMPGSGVPIGGAITGERGQEGVIPLTDSQQMALLGEAIGKYITINANITNTMNGRVISRELQKVQNDSNFAFNR